MVNKFYWILPFAIGLSSLVDAVLIYVYMRFVHQWKDILSSEEASNPQSETEMDPSIKTSMNRPHYPFIESPIELHFRQHPDMFKKHYPKTWQKNGY